MTSHSCMLSLISSPLGVLEHVYRLLPVWLQVWSVLEDLLFDMKAACSVACKGSACMGD